MATTLHWKNVAGDHAFHAARDTKTRARPVLYHGHDFAEIFWIDAGKCLHRINDRAIPLQPGSLVLIRPSDCHGIEPLGEAEVKLTNIAFPRETLGFFQARYSPEVGRLFSTGKEYPTTRQIESPRLRRFNRWADALSESPRKRLFLERFLLNILTELEADQNPAPLDDAPDWLANACRLMQQADHFSGGVAEFCRLCGRSREHVARTVRLHLGTTATDYVNGIRISYAKRQLEMGDKSILEIALDCGIGNLSHFYGLFRAQTAQTPRAYRISHRKPL